MLKADEKSTCMVYMSCPVIFASSYAITSICICLCVLLFFRNPACAPLMMRCCSAYSYITYVTILVHSLYTVFASPMGR